MKTFSFISLCVFLVFIGGVSTYAQPVSRVGPPASATEAQSLLASVPLDLKWDESIRVFEVSVPNDSSRVANVYGVQTTGAVYVVDYPAVIPAKGQAIFVLLYAARPGAGGTSDLLRVITDQAEKVIPINFVREAAIQLGTTTLQWQVGEAAATKEVALSITASKTSPKSVRAAGDGNRAELRSLGNGRYIVAITPGATTKPRQFPVFIEFEKAVPGVATVILCSVVSTN